MGQVSLTERAQTNPGGKRKKLVKHKKSRDTKEKIYRLPSLSKCLEHEILPKSSMMLKQICEIASSNTGFINSHFEEYIKKKTHSNLSSTQALKSTVGLVTSTNNLTKVPALEVKGREKAVSPFKEPAPKPKLGITNLELQIETNVNTMLNSPVIMPAATYTNSARNHKNMLTTSMIGGFSDSFERKVLNTQSSPNTTQNSPAKYYIASQGLPSGATFDSKIPKGVPYKGIFQEIDGIQYIINKESHPAFESTVMRGQGAVLRQSPTSMSSGHL